MLEMDEEVEREIQNLPRSEIKKKPKDKKSRIVLTEGQKLVRLLNKFERKKRWRRSPKWAG